MPMQFSIVDLSISETDQLAKAVLSQILTQPILLEQLVTAVRDKLDIEDLDFRVNDLQETVNNLEDIDDLLNNIESVENAHYELEERLECVETRQAELENPSPQPGNEITDERMQFLVKRALRTIFVGE